MVLFEQLSAIAVVLLSIATELQGSNAAVQTVPLMGHLDQPLDATNGKHEDTDTGSIRVIETTSDAQTSYSLWCGSARFDPYAVMKVGLVCIVLVVFWGLVWRRSKAQLAERFGTQGLTSGSVKYSDVATDDDDGEIVQDETHNNVSKDILFVNKRQIVDPYGEKGVYTGALSQFSKMPHGKGRLEYEKEGRWYEGDWIHGRWTGFGRYSNGDGDFYEGGNRNDHKHGPGTMKFSDGRVFEGEYVRGQMIQGKMTYQDGSAYIGRWSGGMRHGRGKCNLADGSEYDGEFKEGNFHGHGRMTWNDGGWYVGEWCEGEMHGNGKEVRPDGSLRHEGEWVRGKPIRRSKTQLAERFGTQGLTSGSVKYSDVATDDDDGEIVQDETHNNVSKDILFVNKRQIVDPYGEKGVYTGAFSQSTKMPHGKGRLEYEKEGRWYDGDWIHGRWTGFGRYSNGDGDLYAGGNKNDHKHGPGTMKFSDGRVFEGEYIRGQMVEGKMTYQDGSVYIGRWLDGMRHGRGKCVFVDGSEYDGAFKEGNFHGHGRRTWSDGGWYVGEWCEGEMHGNGKEVRPDGSLRHEGEWVRGTPIRTPNN